MTAPDGRIPDSAYVGHAGQANSITDLNNLDEDTAKARMQGTVAPAFNRQRDGVWQNGGLLSNLADLLFGIGGGSPAARLSDGMTELNNRLDLMDEVSGYGGMIMSRNRNMTGGYKTVPFDTRYGPYTPHSVTIDTANHQFILAAGTWSINVLFAIPGHGPFGQVGWHRATITSYYPDGSEHMNQWLDWRSGHHPHTYFAQVPLVVQEDGYTVRVRYTCENLQWLIWGGTDRTKFWVNRWDLRTDDNNMIIDPPDGPDI